MRRTILYILLSLSAPSLMAQRAFERNGDVIYQDASGKQTNLAHGSSPTLNQGKVAMIRGLRVRYGDVDCHSKEQRTGSSSMTR